MVTKEDLKTYQRKKLQLDAYDAQIEHAYDTYKSPTMSASGGHSSDPGDPVTRAMNKIDRLTKRRKILMEKMVEIEQFVDEIDDPLEQAICRYHYIIGLTWDATCYQIRKHHSISVVFDYDAAWWAKREKQEKELKKQEEQGQDPAV